MTGFVEAARREKLKELVERGVAPFAYRFERTATAKQALDAYRSEDDHTSYSLAGRIVALRPHGKTRSRISRTRAARSSCTSRVTSWAPISTVSSTCSIWAIISASTAA